MVSIDTGEPAHGRGAIIQAKLARGEMKAIPPHP